MKKKVRQAILACILINRREWLILHKLIESSDWVLAFGIAVENTLEI